jgi:hypothetical protein
MVAIVTNTLKKQLLDTVYNDLTNGTSLYYIGVGRSEQWDSSDTVPSPENSFKDERDFRLSMQSIKKVVDVSYTIPRYNWTNGTVYNAWDDDLSGTPSNGYYVLTEDNQVYVCLRQGKTAAGVAVTSTIKPTGTKNIPFRTSDGYVWKFMYALSGATSSKFLSANYMPVQRINDSSGSPSLSVIDQQQAAVQEAASIGQVLGVAVVNGGTGYTSAPTITISGDGTGAAATAYVSNGSIVKIELDSNQDSCMTMGYGYNYVGLTFTGGGGSGAVARTIISQDSGIGSNAIRDLRSSSLMFNTKPAGVENNDWLVNDQDYRQIGLIKNPLDYTDSAYSSASGKALRYLLLTSPTDAGTFTRDVTITGGTSGAKAVIDDIDSDKLYAHQNEETGFVRFLEGEQITGGAATGTLTAAGADVDSDAFYNDDINRFTGDLLYLENRAAIARTADQTEDIKIIITL